MLQKVKSPRKSKFKYLLVLPLLAFILVVVSCANDAVDTPVVIEEETSMTTSSRTPVGDAFIDSLKRHNVDGLSFAEIEKAPESEAYEAFKEYLKNHSKEDESVPSAEEFQEILEKSTENKVPFAVIEKTPVFPSCEGDSEEELRSCMNQKINEFVSRQFNTALGKDLGLEGVQTIQTMFTIDKSGNISDVKIRAAHNELEKETRRVLDLLPQFTPGEHRGNKVGVTYTLPIRFEVSSNK